MSIHKLLNVMIIYATDTYLRKSRAKLQQLKWFMEESVVPEQRGLRHARRGAVQAEPHIRHGCVVRGVSRRAGTDRVMRGCDLSCKELVVRASGCRSTIF